MNLTRLILSACAVISSVVCISAYSIASGEPSVSFTAPKSCSKETAAKPKVEILEPLGPLHNVAEPDILEAFKSRVGVMKASGEYDRRFNQNKNRIAKELEQPTAVAGLKKAGHLRVWELSASVPDSIARVSSSSSSIRPDAAPFSLLAFYRRDGRRLSRSRSKTLSDAKEHEGCPCKRSSGRSFRKAQSPCVF